MREQEFMMINLRYHCKRISCHIVHLAHQLLHLRTSESMKLSLESLAFHILHLHIQFEDFSFLMVDLGLCFLHFRKWLFVLILPPRLVCLTNVWFMIDALGHLIRKLSNLAAILVAKRKKSQVIFTVVTENCKSKIK